MTLLKLLLIVALAGGQQDQNEEFWSAARKGDVAAVRALLAKGVDVNAKTRYGATALSYSCDHGNIEMVKLLLEKGADPNTKDTFYGETPLGWAASKGHTDIVRLLLEKGAEGKDRVLMMAAQNGNADLAKVVIELGGVKQDTLNTALSRAFAKNFTEIVEMLKKAGAQPPPAIVQIDPDTLKSYAGAYKNERAGAVIFSFADGKLSGQFSGFAVNLVAIEKTTFLVKEFDGTIIFKVQDGKVTGFALKQSGGILEFTRDEQNPK